MSFQNTGGTGGPNDPIQLDQVNLVEGRKNFELAGTIGGIYEPFSSYVKKQLNIRKALISHANKIKIGNYSFKVGVNYQFAKFN